MCFSYIYCSGNDKIIVVFTLNDFSAIQIASVQKDFNKNDNEALVVTNVSLFVRSFFRSSDSAVCPWIKFRRVKRYYRG